MQSTTFFPGAVRKVVLGPPSMLLGSNRSRRIKIAVKMPLTGEAVVGMPDWLSEAYTAVAKHFPHVTPPLKELMDLSVSFKDTAPSKQLFENPSAKAPSSEIKGFEVMRVGESENPDVELHFQLYCSFSRDFWVWSGEKAGDEVHMYFPPTKIGVHVQPPQLPLDQPSDGLDPKHDAEFAFAAGGSVPKDPTLEQEFGGPQPGSAEYERDVKKALGADKAGPRMVSVKPRPGKAVTSKATKPNGRRSLNVN